MAAGSLRARCEFQRVISVSDGAGGSHVTWSGIYDCRGHFRPERGRERIEAGRMEASLAGVLRVRVCASASALTEADRVQIDGKSYQIKSISNPDQRGRFLEMAVERGVGT